MKHLRVVIGVWFLMGVATLSVPLLAGRSGWPKPALDYAQWLMYDVYEQAVPFVIESSLAACGAMVAGAALLFFGVARAWALFALGLALHLYSRCTTIPMIAGGLEIVLGTAFHMLCGLVLGIAMCARDSSSSKPVPIRDSRAIAS